MKKRGRPPKTAKKAMEAVGEVNKSMASAKQEREAVVGEAKTNFPLPPNSSCPQFGKFQDPNPNFKPEPCLQDQHQIQRPHVPAVSSFSTVESISNDNPQLEQLNFLQKMLSATPKAQNQTFMSQSSVPEPTTITSEHQKSLHDEHHKKNKSEQHSRCHSLPEIASQQRLASVEVRPDAGVGDSAEGSTRQGQPVPSIWKSGHVEPLETSGANIMHSLDHYCTNGSLKINDRACDAHVVTELNEGSVLPRVVTELNEGSVLPRDKIVALNLPNEILHEQLQAGLANVRCMEMEVLRRFKESNVRLQRISKERDGLALHNNALVTTTSMLGGHSKEQETKLRKLEAELELCKSELSQSKAELEQTEIELEIELGAAKHEMAEIEVRHQAVLNEFEAKLKAGLSEATEMAVKDFKRSKAFEDDLVVLIAPAYGMGFTEALDLANSSGASIDLSQESFARTYQPGLRDELMRRVALFKEGKDLSEFYRIAGQAKGEQVVPERSGPSGDETAEDKA